MVVSYIITGLVCLAVGNYSARVAIKRMANNNRLNVYEIKISPDVDVEKLTKHINKFFKKKSKR